MLDAARYLAAHGFTPHTLPRCVRAVGPDESLLLVGSVAEGLAHANSDLDLLLIERDDPEREAMHQDTLTTRPDGFAVNVEIVGIEAVHALGRRFVSCLDAAVHINAATPVLGFLGFDDQRLLHRLSTGVVLVDPACLMPDLRHDYRLSQLADFLVVQHASCFLRLLADARHAAQDGSDPDTARLMASLAARHLAATALAAVGETNPNPKWCLRLLRDHAPSLRSFAPPSLTRALVPTIDGPPLAHVDDLEQMGDTVLTALQDRFLKLKSPLALALASVRAGHA